MPARVVGITLEVGVLQALDTEHRVDPAGIEVEGPAACVVRRSAQAHRDDVLEAEQGADDDRPVGPGARPRGDQPVAARLDRPRLARPGDPVGEVVHVAVEGLAVLHEARITVSHASRVSGCDRGQSPARSAAATRRKTSLASGSPMLTRTPSPAKGRHGDPGRLGCLDERRRRVHPAAARGSCPGRPGAATPARPGLSPRGHARPRSRPPARAARPPPRGWPRPPPARRWRPRTAGAQARTAAATCSCATR